MPEGSSIINTASVNADAFSPHLRLTLQQKERFTTSWVGSLSFWLSEHPGQRRRARPGLTLLILLTMPVEAVTHFGKQVPVKRPGAAVRELASVYVMFASEEASYVSGATVAGSGKFII